MASPLEQIDKSRIKEKNKNRLRFPSSVKKYTGDISIIRRHLIRSSILKEHFWVINICTRFSIGSYPSIHGSGFSNFRSLTLCNLYVGPGAVGLTCQ